MSGYLVWYSLIHVFFRETYRYLYRKGKIVEIIHKFISFYYV